MPSIFYSLKLFVFMPEPVYITYSAIFIIDFFSFRFRRFGTKSKEFQFSYTKSDHVTGETDTSSISNLEN